MNIRIGLAAIGLIVCVSSAQAKELGTGKSRLEVLDTLGLQPPEVELVFGQGTNDLQTIQFGKVLTTRPGAGFAAPRRGEAPAPGTLEERLRAANETNERRRRDGDEEQDGEDRFHEGRARSLGLGAAEWRRPGRKPCPGHSRHDGRIRTS